MVEYRCAWLRVFVVIVVAAGLSTLSACAPVATNRGVQVPASGPRTPASLEKGVLPPGSMEELVAKADVIVIGRVGAIVSQTREGPYNANALPQDPRDVPPLPSLPFTYYKIEVEEVIMDDGTLAAGRPLILRVYGHVNREEGQDLAARWPMPRPGERRLFVLRRNPDSQSYGPWGGWGLLRIDGDVVTFSDRERTPVQFTERRTPREFLAELKRAVRAREGTAQ